MPWLDKGRAGRRKRAADHIGEAHPLIADVWKRLQIVQQHGAANATISATTNAELAILRGKVENLTELVQKLGGSVSALTLDVASGFYRAREDSAEFEQRVISAMTEV